MSEARAALRDQALAVAHLRQIAALEGWLWHQVSTDHLRACLAALDAAEKRAALAEAEGARLREAATTAEGYLRGNVSLVAAGVWRELAAALSASSLSALAAEVLAAAEALEAAEEALDRNPDDHRAMIAKLARRRLGEAVDALTDAHAEIAEEP